MALWLRHDPEAGLMWVSGDPDEVWNTIQAMSRLGVGVEVDAMGTRTDVRSGMTFEVWSIRVPDRRLAQEFYVAMTE